MTFAIITHVNHGTDGESFYAYEPYVKEMNVWLKFVEHVIIVAPMGLTQRNAININYQHHNIDFRKVQSFNLVTIADAFISLFRIPVTAWIIFKAMRDADHIHLRCPGNMGLLGCLIQILFPGKSKTAKYAGNWDWNSKQPWSYRMQQRILRNTFFTRKMKVLVYGNWPDNTANIQPFFTASYSSEEAVPIVPRMLDPNKTIRLLFAGTLSPGKNPMLSLQIAEKMKVTGLKPELHFYGEGTERRILENYIHKNSLEKIAFLHGNCDKEEMKKAYSESHFLLFISKSEGWPKVVSEAMFWACVPITTKVSCVPEMLNDGERGDLIEENIDDCMEVLQNYFENRKSYSNTASLAMHWSRKYTLEFLENEIKRLLNP